MIRFFSKVAGTLKILLYKICSGRRLKLNGLPSFLSTASIRTRKKSRIVLNKRSYFDKGTLLRVTENATFTIGKNSGFNSYCVITCRDKITIGDNVMFGPFVTIHDHDHVYKTEGLMKTSGYVTAPITIEDNVWIGGNVVILKGVTIGSGSVIAAGSIVNKDVPPNTIMYNKKEVVKKEIER
ncbi:MAG: acyltransferase [Clostridia bacterium]|nr:acyltransferase [Clostridia bacterium]